MTIQPAYTPSTRPPRAGRAPESRARALPEPPADFGDIYLRYRGLVHRRARRFCSDEEAQDVVQDVFARAMEKLGGFRGECSHGTWLHQVTTRHCLNRRRDANRRREIVAERGAPVEAIGASQDARVLAGQLWGDLEEELLRVGLYFHLEGMSHAEIAARIGVSRRTVGNRLAELDVVLRSRAGHASARP